MWAGLLLPDRSGRWRTSGEHLVLRQPVSGLRIPRRTGSLTVLAVEKRSDGEANCTKLN